MTAHFTNFGVEEQPITNSLDNVFFSHNIWSGFSIKHFIRPPMHIPEHTLSYHSLQFNSGPSLTMAWKTQGKWIKSICNTGNVVGLISHAEKEELQWENKYHALEITFDPTFIDNLTEKNNFKFREQRNISDSFLKDIADKLYLEIQDGEVTTKLYTESLAIACAIHLTTTYPLSNKKIFAPKGKLSSYQLKNVIDYVLSHLNGIVSLEGLAASAHLSVFHFSRLFKNTVGESPYQFVLQLKIEHAKGLIRKRIAVGDVAYMLGFTDSAHFCNAFKKITGQSPLQFCALSWTSLKTFF